MKKVQMVTPVKISLKDCIFDEDNPNEMSVEQDESLGNSLNEFKYLGDLIVVQPKDKNGKHLVHHGEHRIKKLLEAGNTWAWGFIEKMSKLKHRLYRQTMNHLRGQHDPEKQRAELEYFAKQNKIQFLSNLIAIPKEVLLLSQEIAPAITTDKPMLQHHENTFLEGNLKQMHFIFDNKGFEKIMKKMAVLYKDFKTENHTEIFKKLVDHYIKQRKK